MLVYGLSVPPHDAVGISLVTVGTTAWVGAIDRIRAKEADLRAGITLAVAGMASAPVGAWLNAQMPERALLASFAVLMLFVAVRMIRGVPQSAVDAAARRPRWERLARLALIGLSVGLLAGLFGIGGGFLIVPSLVLLAGLRIQTAAATSLTVIALITTSGIVSFFVAHGHLNLQLSALFVAGSLGGLAFGSRLGRRVSGPWLRRAFAGFVLSVALFVLGYAVFVEVRSAVQP